MTTGRTRAPRTLAALVLGLLLVGCGPQADPAPTPTPTGFASEEEAFAAAEATYRAYIDALNAVDLADPATFEPVYAYLSGEFLDSERQQLSAYHADAYAVSGESLVALIEPVRWESEVATVAACIDVSRVELNDANGKSVVSPDRPDIQSTTATLRTDAASPTGLAIIAIEGRASGPSC